MHVSGSDSLEVFVSIFATSTDGQILLVVNNPKEKSDVAGQVILPGVIAPQHHTIHPRALWYLEEVLDIPFEEVQLEPEFITISKREIHQTRKMADNSDAHCLTRHKIHVWLEAHILRPAHSFEEYLPGDIVRENIIKAWYAPPIEAYHQLRQSPVAWSRTPSCLQKRLTPSDTELKAYTERQAAVSG